MYSDIFGVHEAVFFCVFRFPFLAAFARAVACCTRHRLWKNVGEKKQNKIPEKVGGTQQVQRRFPRKKKKVNYLLSFVY